MSDGQKDFTVWEGIYDEWEDAPLKDGAFDSPKWLDSQAASARSELADFTSNYGSVSPTNKSHDYILPTVLAMAARGDTALKVLDFGGGLASSFFSVASSLSSVDRLEFHVVEGKSVCDKGSDIFPKNMGLYFHDKIPESCGEFDVIHAGSSLQYIDDWRSLLASFARLEPKYLVLADVVAGSIKPFVTVQNYYGYKIRVRFLNLQELIDEMEKLGFQLLYKSLYVAKILGKEQTLPMKNFPEDRRLKHACQLLFKLKPQ